MRKFGHTTIKIALSLGAFALLVGCFNCPDWVEDEVMPVEYNSKVLQVGEGYPCHLDVTIDQNGSEKKLSMCTCGLNSGPWQDIQAGDMLKKAKGSVSLTLSRGDSTIAVFDYPCCDH